MDAAQIHDPGSELSKLQRVFGMAAGLKRDSIVILCFDGEALLEFVNGPSYEAEMASIFSQIGSP
ncbi:hypothetical protein Ahy_B03g067739 isoform C [Arachis hypogaea]|uniref:Uncharacterized protein n=1 Tax=Arachis hypogaea TaxID=3818 RepID=A0A445A7W9_ARAHY|nr:hypothetical protein Ahy_B03g067739 isoform C [Arachis hypogaea]